MVTVRNSIEISNDGRGARPYCREAGLWRSCLTWGMTLRGTHTADENASGEPDWMAAFLLSLELDDLAAATVRGYRYDLRDFPAWPLVDAAVLCVLATNTGRLRQ